jgi:hypothetical protein
MQKSDPPERVLRRAGVTGFPAHATDTQKVGALQLRGRAGDVVTPTRPSLFALSSLPTRSGVRPCDSYDV